MRREKECVCSGLGRWRERDEWGRSSNLVKNRDRDKDRLRYVVLTLFLYDIL